MDENQKNGECLAFAEAIVPVLKEVMDLRRRFGDDPKAYRRAVIDAARRLHSVVMSPARYPAVATVRSLFARLLLTARKKERRIYIVKSS